MKTRLKRGQWKRPQGMKLSGQFQVSYTSVSSGLRFRTFKRWSSKFSIDGRRDILSFSFNPPNSPLHFLGTDMSVRVSQSSMGG
jgi:hypothetical protein